MAVPGKIGYEFSIVRFKNKVTKYKRCQHYYSPSLFISERFEKKTYSTKSEIVWLHYFYGEIHSMHEILYEYHVV